MTSNTTNHADWTLKNGVWMCNKHGKPLVMPRAYAAIAKPAPYPRYCPDCEGEQ